MSQLPRPRNIEEYTRLWEGFDPLDVPNLHLQPSDIVIATFPKCGTTWVQQIVHGLRAHGSMDFDDISLVVPWIETASLVGIDVDAPQVAEPRAFKTHLTWEEVPKGGRYIYVIRDPADALVSLYHFFNGIYWERDCLALEDFCIPAFLNPKWSSDNYWLHLRSWWEHRHRADVLLLCYEDMKNDHEDAVRRIAAFMGLPVDAGRIDLATRQASFEFMRAHQRQFDDHSAFTVLTKMAGIPHDVHATKVREGRVGDGSKVLPESIRMKLDAAWESHIGSPLGIPSYDELRARIR